jgi:hypothetical protein
MGLGLDDAGAGYKEKLARADVHGAYFKGVAHERDFTLPAGHGLLNFEATAYRLPFYMVKWHYVYHG